MKLDQLQSHLRELILLDPVLAALGEPILYSQFLDAEATDALIAARLRTAGIVLQIDQPTAGSLRSLHPGGPTAVRAQIDVLIAESLTLAHAPAETALVSTVVTAITRSRYSPEWISFGGADVNQERGYLLSVVTFSFPVTSS
jgi:hypothetical protein